MKEFFEWLSQHSAATFTLIAAFGVVVTATTLMFLVAFLQGREIHLRSLKIGPKPHESKRRGSNTTGPEENNSFTEKNAIDSIWHTLIDGATESIDVFAGDLSWVERDKDNIRKIIQRGVHVAVLCHNPYQSRQLQMNIRSLLETGAEASFFDGSKYSPPYGLLIDAASPILCTALEVSREPKSALSSGPQRSDGTDIYDYEAVRYVPARDRKHIQVISTLFNAMWEQARNAIVLAPITDLENLLRNELPRLLTLVRQYAGLSSSDISVCNVDVGDIFASCNYVKATKLHAIASVSQSYSDQGLPEYKPCYAIEANRRSLLLPPILEEHSGGLVVVDGTHRLFRLFAERQRANAFCIVLKNAPDLPGRPVPFRDVKAWPRKLPREQVFIEYKPSLYRNFIEMDERLASGVFSDGGWHFK